jgi:hypothetical protein
MLRCLKKRLPRLLPASLLQEVLQVQRRLLQPAFGQSWWHACEAQACGWEQPRVDLLLLCCRCLL